MSGRVIVRFSCGIPSAVTAKLALAEFGADNVEIVRSDTRSEHADNERFMRDCEAWFGKKVTVLASDEYQDIWEVFRRERFIVSHQGAKCRGALKMAPFHEFYRPTDLLLFGYTADKRDAERAVRLKAGSVEKMRFPLIERGLTRSDCMAIVTRAGIERPIMYRLGFKNNNCFAGETEFLTDLGVRSLREAVGETVRVRGAGGGWTPATIQSFGVQKLEKLTLQRPGREKVVYVTAGHRWFVKQHNHGAKVEKTTDQLRAGDRLAAIYGRLGGKVRPSSFGIAQGIVFGDGTRGNTLNTAATLVLCGDKNRELLRFFPLSPVADRSDGIEVRDLPRFWKDAPRLDESQSFLYGWLAGYFAADGHVTSDGSYILSSAKLAHLQTARDVAVRLGIGCHEIRSVERVGLGTEETTLYSLPLIGATLRADFLLLQQHRERFIASQPRDPHRWTVVSVEATDREEEVFCAVVPEGQAFTLDGNILTGNCLGCPKGGMAYWNRIRLFFPEEFERMACIQDELGPGSWFFTRRGERISLRMLNPEDGRDEPEQDFECSIMCALAEGEINDAA